MELIKTVLFFLTAILFFMFLFINSVREDAIKTVMSLNNKQRDAAEHILFMLVLMLLIFLWI